MFPLTYLAKSINLNGSSQGRSHLYYDFIFQRRILFEGPGMLPFIKFAKLGILGVRRVAAEFGRSFDLQVSKTNKERTGTGDMDMAYIDKVNTDKLHIDKVFVYGRL
jgi:hypothetical protein